MKINVNISGKEVTRTVIERKGDKFIRFNNEEFILNPRTNEVVDRVTNNITSAMWDRQNYLDVRLHNPQHADTDFTFKPSFVASSLESLNSWYEKEKDFLYKWYEPDAYELGAWIRYAQETLNGGKN